MPDPLRIAVIGAGAFGRNHLRVLHDLAQTPSQLQNSQLTTQPNPAPPQRTGVVDPNPSPLSNSQLTTQPIHLAAVVDPNPSTRTEAAEKYNIPAFATLGELLQADLGLHAATVCTPTVAHAEAAEQLLSAALDVLVEKPLTATLAEADALIALAHRTRRILAAGHLERFNPAVTAAQTRLTRPMFYEAHRLSVFTPRSLDVDVVLDLMIHDLDILLTFAGSPVTEIRAVGLPVLTRKTDIANVRLEFASGAVANLTASRVSTEQVRKLRLFQPAEYLSLDYARQELLAINVAPALIPTSSRPEAQSAAVERPPASQPADKAQPHPSAGLTFDKQDLPRAEPLRLELQDFLGSVQTRTPPRVTAQAAREALALALEINRTIAAHAHQTGLA